MTEKSFLNIYGLLILGENNTENIPYTIHGAGRCTFTITLGDRQTERKVLRPLSVDSWNGGSTDAPKKAPGQV